MEGRLQERLADVTATRARVLGRLLQVLGPASSTVLESTALFHTLVFFTTLMIVIAIFAQTRRISLFSFHPVLMTLGVLSFFAQGIVAYKNKSLLEIFGPIMQHNKRIKVRVIHQSLQLLGTGFVGMGLLFIFANKAMEKKTIFPHTLHSLFGTLAILLIAIQGASGMQKMAQIESKPTAVKIRRWHGDSGLLLWDLLCITMLLGMLEFLHFNLTNLLIELCVVGCWLMVHAQMRRKGDEAEGDVQASVELVGASSAGGGGAQDGHQEL